MAKSERTKTIEKILEIYIKFYLSIIIGFLLTIMILSGLLIYTFQAGEKDSVNIVSLKEYKEQIVQK